MKDFRELKVWEKAHSLTLAVYRITANFPGNETYGLTSQIRRAASSIAANLAEGCGRDGDKELARYAQIGMGSASELEYHVLLAKDLGYLEKQVYVDFHEQIVEVKRMLAAFIIKLRSDR